MQNEITRDRIQQLIERKKVDMATLSRIGGKNHSYIFQFLTKGTPKELPESFRRKIEEHFELPDGYLTGKETQRTTLYDGQDNDFASKKTAYGFSDKIPVYGYAAGSVDRIAINEGRIVEMRQRGRALESVDDGYYVTVIGDSMEPQMQAGDYLAVNPRMAPVKNRPCVVQFNNGEAVAKIFLSMNDKSVTVQQLNPPRNIQYDMKDVLAVSAVRAIEW